MIAKTITGSDFEGALTYGAGQRQGRGKEPGQAPLLVVSNVIPGSPKEMAQDMQAVAARSKRVQKPVWHTVLSWKAGEVVSQAQKVAAAKRYCELMGAPIERHQIVVYEHRDKQHAHVHIYLNRVPIDGGPALRTDNNFYRQPAVTRQISQELGMDPLPERRRSLKALDPTREAARQRVSQALAQLLRQSDRGGEQWLALQLQKLAIEIRYSHDKGGVLRGVSFATEGVALRGQEVGYKGAQLREALAASVKPVMEPGAERKARPRVSTALPQPAPPERPKQARRKGRRQ
ncbi:relaxase/mobilization nuclease domain-containing protein [Hymenobacter sp. NST-14]|uniref:relaxase/mobilization nuclease domain-containing protein n=1 Tax=Hymenobacter piscis TaxID=2839984 RepID=UPI001C00AC3C|nr:relaxase/mobilization nuclease domain-containing protein [Hymenobacter piscis]MBT9395027.1 relaxase/mobilization nuclease domain-containing protein [Hymenobacter piscis]